MPAQGVPNNPSGSNNWQGFGTEEPYGQGTKNQQLKQGAPLAGAPLSSGPIAAPKRAGRKAQRGATAPPQQAPPPVALPAQQPSYDARLAMYWQAIAAIPGASDLVKTYAALSIQRVSGTGVAPLQAAWGGHPGSGATVGGKAGQGQSGLPPAKPKA